MKTKLVPLALFIPAVVLAQAAPPPPSQGGMPQASTRPAPPANPVNPAKAAAALSTANQLSTKLKGDASSDGSLDCPKGSYTATSDGNAYCTDV
jgi:hypothetical protein